MHARLHAASAPHWDATAARNLKSHEDISAGLTGWLRTARQQQPGGAQSGAWQGQNQDPVESWQGQGGSPLQEQASTWQQGAGEASGSSFGAASIGASRQIRGAWPGPKQTNMLEGASHMFIPLEQGPRLESSTEFAGLRQGSCSMHSWLQTPPSTVEKGTAPFAELVLGDREENASAPTLVKTAEPGYGDSDAVQGSSSAERAAARKRIASHAVSLENEPF